MSDASIATIVSGCITVVTMLIGFGTLWLKFRETQILAVKTASTVETIHTLTDGGLTKVNEKLDKANQKVDQLQEAAVKRAEEATKKVEAKIDMSMGQLESKLNGGH